MYPNPPVSQRPCVYDAVRRRVLGGALAEVRRRRAARAAAAENRAVAGMLAVFVLFAVAVLIAWGGVVAASSAIAMAQDGIRRYPIGQRAVGKLDAKMPQTTTITARDGSLVSHVNDVHFGWRQDVPLGRIAPSMIEATLAAEDRRFFSHSGVDPIGLGRALLQNSEEGEIRSGASTLDMQLVRDLLLRDERNDQTLTRKAKEAIVAIQLNQRYAKREILEAYLNTVYYGNMAYGVEAAAQRYFGKSASDLTLPEAALLAGMPQAPSAYNPRVNPENAEARRSHVLDLMATAGFITPEQAEEARAEPLGLPDRVRRLPPPSHWGNYVQDVVRNRFGPEALYTAGLYVETTLDPRVQQIAEQVVQGAENVRALARANNIPRPRQQHVGRRDRHQDQRDPCAGREQGLQRYVHRGAGQRGSGRTPAGVVDQAAGIPGGFREGTVPLGRGGRRHHVLFRPARPA